LKKRSKNWLFFTLFVKKRLIEERRMIDRISNTGMSSQDYPSPNHVANYNKAVADYNAGDLTDALKAYIASLPGGQIPGQGAAEEWIQKAEAGEDPGGPPPCPWL
jgi:hypothetical protein